MTKYRYILVHIPNIDPMGWSIDVTLTPFCAQWLLIWVSASVLSVNAGSVPLVLRATVGSGEETFQVSMADGTVLQLMVQKSRRLHQLRKRLLKSDHLQSSDTSQVVVIRISEPSTTVINGVYITSYNYNTYKWRFVEWSLWASTYHCFCWARFVGNRSCGEN